MSNKVVRYNPDYKEGLTTSQVNNRIANNLINYNDQPPTKTIKQIITSNVFTYFNIINMILATAILGAGIYGGAFLESIKNCLFIGVVICNSIISIIQEIISKKTIENLKGKKFIVKRRIIMKKVRANVCVILGVLLLTAGIMSGCGENKNELRIGYFPNLTHSQALVMREQGNLEKSLEGKYLYKL